MTLDEYEQVMHELSEDTCSYASLILELINENRALKQRLGDTPSPLPRDSYGYIEYDTNLLDNIIHVDNYEQIESVYVIGDLVDENREFNTAFEFIEWNERYVLLMDKAKGELLKSRSIYKLRINFILLQCAIKLIVLATRAKKRVQIEYAIGGKRAELLKQEYEADFIVETI